MVMQSVQGHGRTISSSGSTGEAHGARDSRAETCWVGESQPSRGLEKNFLKIEKEKHVRIQRWGSHWRTERSSVSWGWMPAKEVK